MFYKEFWKNFKTSIPIEFTINNAEKIVWNDIVCFFYGLLKVQLSTY